jgi:hypothetical protein
LSFGTLSVDTWYHIAVAKKGSSWAAWLNGTRGSTVTSASTPYYNVSALTKIGAYAGGLEFEGYIDDVRIINGLAIYDPASASITVPAAELGIVISNIVDRKYNSGIWSLSDSYDRRVENIWPTTTRNEIPFTASYLVIAGGGGGGYRSQGVSGGGAGAGGYRTSAGPSGRGASAESDLNLVTGPSYSIIVGAGGTGGSTTVIATNGSNSVLSNITATGGGRGGAGGAANGPGSANGGNGGSGGGAAYISGGVNGTRGTGTSSQGRDGGNANGLDYSAGGGGSEGTGNDSAAPTTAGAGGIGLASSITGSSVTRGGGGGGGAVGGPPGGAGGSGGGGAGGSGSSSGISGTPNTGGGGGGAGQQAAAGGNGGSGVVIIKIPNTVNAVFSSGVTSSVSTSVPGYKIYTVTATSTTFETVTFEVP